MTYERALEYAPDPIRSLVTVEITLTVTVPVEEPDADRAMDDAEGYMQNAVGDVIEALQRAGAEGITMTMVEALECEPA